MAIIRTVLGDIDADTLGVTDAHEHLFIMGGVILLREPGFRLDDLESACTEVQSFLAAGGGAFLEATPLGCGRSPQRLVELSKRTGAHIIAATGFHKEEYYDSLHWIHHYSVDQLTQLIVTEITEGMDENGCNGPFAQTVDARAGAIKIATDYQQISRTTEKLMEAAAAAHQMTGAPIFTHTEQGTMALEQVEKLTRLGVAPQHLVIGHLDRNPDLAYHREVAATGAFLEYDTPGRIKYQPESLLIGLIEGMAQAGYGGNLLLGGDLARRSYWRAYGGGPGLAYLLERFVPRLRAGGIDETVIHALLVANPARAFMLKEGSRV